MSNLKTLKCALVGFSLLASGLAMAGDKLNCPAGTRQAGSPEAGSGLVSCVDANGNAQGPYVAYDDAGRVAARGTMKDNFRDGKTTYFNAKGQKIGETEFRGSRYHGKRVEYFANGRIKSERTYTDGGLEGSLREYDASGAVVRAEEFKADRKVAALQ